MWCSARRPATHPSRSSWWDGTSRCDRRGGRRFFERSRSDARWCFCSNGRALRIVDAQHTWSRDYLEFDLALLPVEPLAQRVLWVLAGAEACAATPPVLDTAAAASARQGVAVCRALGDGVLEALDLPAPGAATQAARGHGRRLRAVAHRRCIASCSCSSPKRAGSCRSGTLSIAIATRSSRSSARCWRAGRYRGVWQAVQAISRLAHAGCAAGELKVTAFNGRLFAPGRASAFDRSATRRPRDGTGGARRQHDDGDRRRRPIAHRVSRPRCRAARRRLRACPRLRAGSVGAAVLGRTRDTRKSTGTFYTPRAVTDFLVRHTLAPLTAGRSSRRPAVSAHSRSRDGERCLPRGCVSIPRRCRRRRTDSRGSVASGRCDASGTRRPEARNRAAMPLRRRSEPDGGAGRAALDLARHACG